MPAVKKIAVVGIIGIVTYLLVLNIFTGLRIKGYSYLFRAARPYDLVLKHALILDGSGENEKFRGDIAIKDGYIAAVGYINAKESPSFDAGGLMVIPYPVKIEKNDEVLEHLLSTAYPRFPAENIFLCQPPYEGVSLAQAARAAGRAPAELQQELAAGTKHDAKVLLVKIKVKEGSHSIEEELALLTGLRAEALGLKAIGLVRSGYRANLHIFKNRDYSDEELKRLFATGSFPEPVYRIENGGFIQ